jgi:hypothetical protein
MLSTEKHGLKPIPDLPLRGQELFKPFYYSITTNPSPVGMVQKTVLLEPNGMALWVGSHVIASVVLKDLAAAYAQGQRPNLKDVIHSSGIAQSEADQISIIAFLDHGDAILQQVLNTERLERRFASILYAGNGSYPGILDIDDGVLAGDVVDFHRGYLNRLIRFSPSSPLRELWDDGRVALTASVFLTCRA